MRTLLIAFLLGSVAVGIVLLVTGFAVGIAAQAGDWGNFRIGVGRVVALEFRRSPDGSSTTFGSGILIAAAVGGALNAAAAAFLSRRGR